jgi:xylan 1,4-beta-xylosidase
VHLTIRGLTTTRSPQARIWRVDHEHGDAFAAWQAMGSPQNPTAPQIQQLIRASQIASEPIRGLSSETQSAITLSTRVPLHGVALIDLDTR